MSTQQPDPERAQLALRRLVASVAVALIMLGQVLLFSDPVDTQSVVPADLWVSLLGVLLLIGSFFLRPGKRLGGVLGRLEIPWTLSWISAAVLLSGLTMLASLLFLRNNRYNYIPVVTLWLASGLCYLTALGKTAFSNFPWKAWLREHRSELLAVAAVTLLAAVFRFIDLGQIPRVVDGDEGRLGLAAQSTVSTALANPFALWENFGGLYLQLVNIVIRLLGSTPLAVRLLPALSGVLAVPCLYLIGREIAGRRPALIASILLAISHTHIHFSRVSAVGYIHESWLIPLELYLLLSGLNRRSALRTGAAGLLLAVHYSVYLTSQVMTALVLVFMLAALIFLPRWFRPAWKQALAFWGGLGIMILPELQYALQHPAEFTNRLLANGTFQTGWLEETMASTGQGALAVLGGRVVHAFMSLIYYPAYDFYGSSIPMLTLISATLFLSGMAFALWKVRSPGYLLLNGYFWSLTLAVGIFAIPPSADSYRMLVALPPALLMAAVAIDQLLEIFGLGWEKARRAYLTAVSFVLVSLLAFNLWAYYGDFAGMCRYGDNQAGRFASYLGNYARTIENEFSIYLLSDEHFFYGSHASVDYLSGRREIINYPDPADTLQAISGETIIASPPRIDELEAWMRSHPGGVPHYQYDCSNVILFSYRVP